MKKTAFYNSLIRGMEKLYKRVSLILLRKRMDGYHMSASQGHKFYGDDIKSPLLDCIDNIIVNNTDVSKTRHSNGHPVPDSTASPNTVANSNADKKNAADESKAENPSGSFIERADGSDLYPEIANKLEHSIWEHIHATIRYARQGDKSNAIMHSDIANSACTELAHYIDEEQYQEFIMKVGEHLNSFKPA